MTSITPPTPYSPTELAALYPSSLALQQVHIFLRHGERTPVRHRFVHLDHPKHWPYCSYARTMRSIITTPSGPTGTPSETEMHWRRKLTVLSPDGSYTPHPTPAGHLVEDLCPLGTLTNAGRQTTYALGTHLRQLYVTSLGFLPPKLSSQSLLGLRATAYPRALESLQHAITGLYPPATRAPDLPPFEISMTAFSNETLFPNTTGCARLGEIATAFKKRAATTWDNSPAVDKLNMMIGSYLTPDPTRTARTGILSQAPALVGVLDSINASRATGTTSAVRLPNEFYHPEIIATAEAASVDEWYSLYAESSEARRLGMGPLLSGVVSDLVSSAEGISTQAGSAGDARKISLAGCHDTTLASMLTSLGASDGRWPPFTSHVAVELFREASKPGPKAPQKGWFGFGGAPKGIGQTPMEELPVGQRKALEGYFVRIRYNDKAVTIPGCKVEGKHLKGHETFCTLSAFKEIVDHMTPKNWKIECGQNLKTPAIPTQPEPAGY